MDKILLVCSSEKGTKIYTENLKSMGYLNVNIEGNGAAARRKLIQDEYNIIIIDTPLKDEFGSDLALKATETGQGGVILVVKSENADMVGAKVSEYGVFVIPKPFTRAIFNQGVKFVFTSLRRLSVLKDEHSKLRKQVDDIKRIDRAKCLLIQYNKMTEEEAHRYLEKQAMDTRLSRREVAEKLIKFFEV